MMSLAENLVTDLSSLADRNHIDFYFSFKFQPKLCEDVNASEVKYD